jgi:hypothetical protein
MLVALVDFIVLVGGQVASTLVHNWPFLAVGIVSAAALKVYVGIDRVAALFRRRTGVAVVGSVAAAVATPFCSCGTTAVVLSMLASAVPWAPVVAFMVASPLTSPDELLVSAGLFGWAFALLFFAASIAIGLAGGAAAWAAERAGLLANQARFAGPTTAAQPIAAAQHAAAAKPGTTTSCDGGTCGAPALVPAGIGPGAAAVAEFTRRADAWRLRELARESASMAARMLPLFIGFAALGYAVIALVPTAWLTTLLGGSGPVSVVLAATLGVPFYFSTEASLPLLASLVHGGMGQGPAMAFLVTGAGTSIGAITGGLLIARWRVLAIVVATLWVGAVAFGLLAGLVL